MTTTPHRAELGATHIYEVEATGKRVHVRAPGIIVAHRIAHRKFGHLGPLIHRGMPSTKRERELGFGEFCGGTRERVTAEHPYIAEHRQALAERS